MPNRERRQSAAPRSREHGCLNLRGFDDDDLELLEQLARAGGATKTGYIKALVKRHLDYQRASSGKQPNHSPNGPSSTLFVPICTQQDPLGTKRVEEGQGGQGGENAPQPPGVTSENAAGTADANLLSSSSLSLREREGGPGGSGKGPYHSSQAPKAPAECPKCRKGPMLARRASTGRFWGCRAFPRCTGRRPFLQAVEDAGDAKDARASPASAGGSARSGPHVEPARAPPADLETWRRCELCGAEATDERGDRRLCSRCAGAERARREEAEVLCPCGKPSLGVVHPDGERYCMACVVLAGKRL